MAVLHIIIIIIISIIMLLLKLVTNRTCYNIYLKSCNIVCCVHKNWQNKKKMMMSVLYTWHGTVVRRLSEAIDAVSGTCNSSSVTGFKLGNSDRVCFFTCLSSVLIFSLHISQLFQTFTVHTAVNYSILLNTPNTQISTPHFLQTAKSYHVLYDQWLNCCKPLPSQI